MRTCARKVSERLRQVEADANLFAFSIDGWSAWRVMRNVVERTTSGMPVTLPGRSRTRRVVRALRGALSLTAVLLRGERVGLIVKTTTSALRDEREGRFRDIYFDALLDRTDRWLKIEEDNSHAFTSRAKRAEKPAQLDATTFTLFGRIMGRLAPAPIDGFARQAHAAVAAEFHTAPSVQTLRMRVSTVRWQARLFGLLLRRVRPRAVLVSDTGEYALILACRRVGVPVIELQHGVFNAAHPDAIPLSAGDAAAMLIPHALATRGRYWISELAGAHHGKAAVAVGVDAVDRGRIHRAGRTRRTRFVIVVASQGVESEALADWLARAADMAPEQLDWRIIIKLHPTYDSGTSAFDSLATRSTVEVVAGAATPSLFDLLTDADLHLSISSAAHFDALALGVPSAVVPLRSWEDVEPAVRAGHLVRLDSPVELWSRPWRPVDPAISAQYCEPGFVENMERLVLQLTDPARSDPVDTSDGLAYSGSDHQSAGPSS